MNLRTWLIVIVVVIVVTAVALVVAMTPREEPAAPTAPATAAALQPPAIVATPPGLAGTTVLGSRGVPGYVIAVGRESAEAPVAGGSCRLRISVRPDGQGPQPARVEAWLAAEPNPKPTTTAAATGAAPGEWTVTLAIPSPLPKGLSAWVRATMPDGSVFELGRDFPLR